MTAAEIERVERFKQRLRALVPESDDEMENIFLNRPDLENDPKVRTFKGNWSRVRQLFQTVDSATPQRLLLLPGWRNALKNLILDLRSASISLETRTLKGPARSIYHARLAMERIHNHVVSVKTLSKYVDNFLHNINNFNFFRV